MWTDRAASLDSKKTLQLFLSWTGKLGLDVALILRGWIPAVLPTVEPWVSSEDISKGKPWSRELADRLEESLYCVVCVLPGSAQMPWINFEAGAVARVVAKAHVSPLLFGVAHSELVGLPLGLFQATLFERSDVLKLMISINAASTHPVTKARLNQNFDIAWPNLDSRINEITSGTPTYSDQPQTPHLTQPRRLDQLDRKLLVHLSAVTDPLPAEVIAESLGLNATRVRFHLDRLLDEDYVEFLPGVYGSVYMLGHEGRAYLVENDLV